MPSVAERIYRILVERLHAIRGEGDMVNDLQGRVLMQRFTVDLVSDDGPTVCIAPRQGGGFAVNQRPGDDVYSDTTLTFDVVGAVPSSEDPEAAVRGLRLLADLYRALEVPADKLLDVEIDGRAMNLLTDPLRIVDAQFEPAPDGFSHELVGVGVQCTYQHFYGDPDRVEE